MAQQEVIALQIGRGVEQRYVRRSSYAARRMLAGITRTHLLEEACARQQPIVAVERARVTASGMHPGRAIRVCD